MVDLWYGQDSHWQTLLHEVIPTVPSQPGHERNTQPCLKARTPESLKVRCRSIAIRHLC
jgi:hypothetical protein